MVFHGFPDYMEYSDGIYSMLAGKPWKLFHGNYSREPGKPWKLFQAISTYHGQFSTLFFKNIDAGKGWKLSPNTPASYFPWISMENPGQSTPGLGKTQLIELFIDNPRARI